MNKALFLGAALSLVISNSFAAELTNFNDIKAAVLNGKTIHMAINFTKCTTSTHQKFAHFMANTIGVVTPNVFQVHEDMLITSITHFTLNHPQFPQRPVQEYITFRITEENELKMTHQSLDAAHYMPISGLMNYTCEIGSDAKVYD